MMIDRNVSNLSAETFVIQSLCPLSRLCYTVEQRRFGEVAMCSVRAVGAKNHLQVDLVQWCNKGRSKIPNTVKS